LGVLNQLHNLVIEQDRRSLFCTVVNPAHALIEDLAPRVRAISPAHGEASLMRPNRDTRFSKDKRPYKDWVGIHFKHDAGKEAPGFHVHLARNESGAGGGMGGVCSGPRAVPARAGGRTVFGAPGRITGFELRDRSSRPS
jgi:uncharacterized protein (TIGR02453 family)